MVMDASQDPPPAYVTPEESSTYQTEPTEKSPLSCSSMSETLATSFEKDVRRLGFIQKVLAIKLLQAMAVTVVMAGFVGGGYSVYSVMVLDMTYRINFIVISTLMFVAVVASLNYCKRARIQSPNCYIFLAAYPLSGGTFFSVVLYGWALNSVLLSWVQFNIVMLILLLYSIWSFDTKIEFKTNIGLYMAGGFFIVTYAFTVPFIYGINIFAVLYSSLMMFLMTTYILYDIEAMISKDYRTTLTSGDFVKASILMHVDQHYLFMKTFNKIKRSNQVQSV